MSRKHRFSQNIEIFKKPKNHEEKNSISSINFVTVDISATRNFNLIQFVSH